MKQVIKLTENDLKKLIKESMDNLLEQEQNFYDKDNQVIDAITEQLSEAWNQIQKLNLIYGRYLEERSNQSDKVVGINFIATFAKAFSKVYDGLDVMNRIYQH